MKAIDIIALLLVIVGGLNWGLVGIFDFNLVEAIFGTFPNVVNAIYGLVGVAALWAISLLFRVPGRTIPIPPTKRYERVEAEKQRETVPPSEPAAKR